MEEIIKTKQIARKMCSRTVQIMKISTLLLFLSVFVVNAEDLYPQQKELSLNLRNVTLQKAIAEIEKSSDYVFLITDEAGRELNKRATVQVTNESIHSILEMLLKGTSLRYSVVERQVSLYKNPDTEKSAHNLQMTPKTVQQQKKTITGTVTDNSGLPVIGANIVEAGTANGTVTNINGTFSLSVEDNATIKISYIGYLEQNINVSGKTSFNVTLQEDMKALEEVIVIGYGTQRKSDVSGSVTTVSGDKLAKIPTANAESALQGMAPGLSVNFGSGAAGSVATLQVRGVTTWGTDNSPLVIIDGVPGDMSYLNPEDIKTMSVLKDAATAAIYGARSAAGVILIETHRGVMQSPKIHFSSYWGIDDLPKRMEVCNSAEFVKIRKMALSNAGIAQNRWPKYISEYERDPSQFADTDWQKEYYRRGLTQKYNVGYISGNNTTNVAFSAFYIAAFVLSLLYVMDFNIPSPIKM